DEPRERGGSEPREGRAEAQAERPAPEPEDPRRQLLAGFDPRVHEAGAGPHEGRRVARLEGGRRAVLTLDPGLQAHLEGELARYEVPYGAVVAMEPSSGRVLAYVSHSSANPGAGDLVLDPTPPTASVFKVVTGAALVDAGVGPNTRTCYSGGASRLTLANLEDRSSDRRCATLAEAMGGSVNAIFAKLSDRHLDRATLRRYASAFGFGHALPFDVPLAASPSEVPEERLERARTAAGFWHMHMSPLHGALIASTIANDGQMPRAAIVERVEAPDGTALLEHEPEVFRNVVPRRTAQLVNQMMRETVTPRGTARRDFFDPQGRPFLQDITVAGKTGTLSAERPYRGYTWFVGSAPADDPQVAVAALVVNTPRWRIKATYLAREALRYALIEGPQARAREAEEAAETVAEESASGDEG
ncbi:MAG TPA: penicillin-binding transpeptidase domain-containing protein, partial [Polyangiaceae bacterium LLY-WYZ-15_(1-7)]|nr:penicillin-binding transpeptidase domain-containing protein [Polyangiaceae bacterium LLY-WYZ-15_(1-7)]